MIQSWQKNHDVVPVPVDDAFVGKFVERTIVTPTDPSVPPIADGVQFEEGISMGVS